MAFVSDSSLRHSERLRNPNAAARLRMGHMAALGRPRATASIGYRHPAPTPSPLHLWVHSALATAFRPRPSGRLSTYRPVGFSVVSTILVALLRGARRREGEPVERALRDRRRGAADAPSTRGGRAAMRPSGARGPRADGQDVRSSVNPYYEPLTFEAIGLLSVPIQGPIDTITEGEVCAACS
jgi:hypothetical protein